MCKSLITLIAITLVVLLPNIAAVIQNVVTESSNLSNETETDTNTIAEVYSGQETSTNEILSRTYLPAATPTPTVNGLKANTNTTSLTTSKTTTTTSTTPPTATTSIAPEHLNHNTTFAPLANVSVPVHPYCSPSLCQFFNGTDIEVLPHIACENHGNFSPTCGSQPHLLYMSDRRRNLILDLHNLARSRIASGQVAGYQPASHMPQLKWDTELEYLATLHAKRCKFTHDLCRNTPRFEFSGQNIGYYWIGREIKSHSRRMKNFIVNWFKEYMDANQTFIDSYHKHPDGKKIGHFTQMVGDRVHRVGCAAIRYQEPDQLPYTKFLLTCNYDFTNLFGEPIYQSGPTASKCAYKKSDKFPALCDWKVAAYEYESEEMLNEDEVLDNDISK